MSAAFAAGPPTRWSQVFVRTSIAATDRLLRGLSYLGDFVLLMNQTVQHLLRGEVTRRETFAQLAAMGVGSLPLVVVTVAFSGMVFGVYAVAQFRQMGATDLIGALVAMSMSREVAPVLAATVVAARCGSAIAAEVGTMKITEQLDALRSLATDPVEYLAVPRYIGLVLMLPLLTFVAMLAGIWGAGVMGSLQAVPWSQYIASVWDRLPLEFVLIGVIKGMVFGALIAVSSYRQGVRAGFGSESVGRATTQAVVNNILWIHAANLLLATV